MNIFKFSVVILSLTNPFFLISYCLPYQLHIYTGRGNCPYIEMIQTDRQTTAAGLPAGGLMETNAKK